VTKIKGLVRGLRGRGRIIRLCYRSATIDGLIGRLRWGGWDIWKWQLKIILFILYVEGRIVIYVPDEIRGRDWIVAWRGMEGGWVEANRRVVRVGRKLESSEELNKRKYEGKYSNSNSNSNRESS